MPFLHIRPPSGIHGRTIGITKLGAILLPLSILLLSVGCTEPTIQKVLDIARHKPYPPDQTAGWHYDITATYFDIARYRPPQTAWNDIDPLTENPYHLALPFNDHVPGYQAYGPCKNRWVEIIEVSSRKRAFGQWEDVGPWFVNDVDYVFDETGTVRPFAEIHEGERFNIYRQRAGRGARRPRKILNGAGIDLSPRLARFLGIRGKGRVDWRFVEATQVPPGPWREKVSTRPPRYRKRFYFFFGERYLPWELTTTRYLR